MLGRLEMDVDQCITAYSELMKAVFKKKVRCLPIGWKIRVKPQFDSKKLKSAIEEVIRDGSACTTDAFNDGKQRGCRT